jgi:hypothetical protein
MQAHQGTEQAAVYVLLRRDRKRFKVGWSVDPLKRARQLPEHEVGKLDLSASVALWLPNRKRAEQIEGAVHKCLAPFPAKTGHRLDGHTEWFRPQAHATAIRMLSQTPIDERADRRPALMPLTAGAPAPNSDPAEIGPQDTWWALEDLWSRLAMHCNVTVEHEGGAPRIVIAEFRHAMQGPVGALRRHVMDTDTYCWHAAGETNEFVKLIDYRGNDLVCTLASARHVQAWPDGDDLVWQMKGFLLRLERMSHAAHCGRERSAWRYA